MSNLLSPRCAHLESATSGKRPWIRQDRPIRDGTASVKGLREPYPQRTHRDPDTRVYARRLGVRIPSSALTCVVPLAAREYALRDRRSEHSRRVAARLLPEPLAMSSDCRDIESSTGIV